MRETFGDYVREARENLGLTQVALAQQLDISDVYVSRIETGRSMPARRLLSPLARALRRPIVEIERRWMAQKAPDSMRLLLEPKARARGAQTAGSAEAPVVGFIGANDHAPDFDDMDLAVGAALDHLPRPYWAGERTFGLIVRGDSMRPLLNEGDMLLADPERADPQNGDLAVVRDAEGRAYVKLWTERNGIVILKSYNPAHEDIVLKREEVGFAYKVVGVFRR